MAVITQEVGDRYAVYNGDCCEVIPGLPAESVHLSLYSPPFAGLYHYSSSERDMSNARSYVEFMEHYAYLVRELYRITLPGRISGVHCMDIPRDGANTGAGLLDFPGDIIRMHEEIGFSYCCRYHVWKEPMEVRNRTMARGLAHRQVVEDSTLCDVASADYLLMFRKKGENPIPVAHPKGLKTYAGSRQMPADNYEYRNWSGKQTQNKFSHWIWRQYASAFWDDVRLDRVLPSGHAKEHEDERHMHPLQLDVIERCIVLWSNPGETVLTPFMGVGSEVYGALINDRRAIGVELKPSYYRHALNNIRTALECRREEDGPTLFDALAEEPDRAD